MDVQGIMDMDMGGKKPFDYQARAVIESRSLVAAGKRKLILMAPTGAGKTLMSCILIKLAEQKGKKILFLAPRRVLIRQTSAHLWDCGVNHGIICAGWELQPEFPVQVASKDTLASRTIRKERIEVPFCDIVVIDECLRGDSIVETDVGSIPIEEVQLRGASRVLSYDITTKSRCWKNIVAFNKTGTKKTITVSLSNGRKITCTNNHLILTKAGWKLAADLIVGEHVLYTNATTGNWNTKSSSPMRQIVNVDAENKFFQSQQHRDFCESCGRVNTVGLSEDINVARNHGSLNSQTLKGKQFSERYSETSASLTRTLQAQHRDYTDTTLVPRSLGFFIKHGYLNDYAHTSVISKTMVTANYRRPLRQSAFQHCERFIISYDRLDSVKRCHENGLTELETSDSHGGFVMMDQQDVASRFTRKVSLSKKTKSLCNGSLTNTDQPVFTEAKQTDITGCTFQQKPEVTSLLQSHLTFQNQCDTNWVAVNSIQDDQECDVFDIEVEDTHCFFANGILVHNCHLSLATEHLKLLYAIEKKNPQCVFVGLSATPGRNDGKGMGDFYDALVNVARYDELIARKRLVPCKAFAPDAPNMRGVKQKEWDQEAAKRMDVPKLVGDVIQHWIRLGEDRPTVVFAANIAHSLHLRDEFVRHGISCEHIDQSTEEVDREAVLGRLEDGSTKVVTNCDLLSAGWDQPSVSCCVLACPSRSLTRYRQRAGRTFRVSPGKDDALLIDHSGGIFMHGFPDEDIEWPLDKSHSIDRDYQEKRNQGKTREPMVCPKCYTIFSGRSDCPSCGNKFIKRGRDVAIAKGLLKEVKRTDTAPQREHMTLDDRKKYWKKCVAICVNQGKNCKAAAAMYASKVGEAPWDSGISGLPSRGEWSLPAAKVFPQFVR